MSGFWSGKRVLVTGADGFIGSHLTERLVKEGAVVKALVYYNSFSNWGWLHDFDKDVLRSIEVFPGDIRDPIRTQEAVDGSDIVFHLASLIAIPYSYHAPDSYVQTNINGGINVLNACRRCGIMRLVHTSTSEVYGTARYAPIDENHPLQGQSPYSASKIGADMLVESYYRSFGLPVSIVRPFNTYGPRQSARAVIPTVLSQLHAGMNKIKLGTLTPTRDFNFVSDTVSGFLAVGESDSTVGRTVNIGSGREISIAELVELAVRITGRRTEIVEDSTRLRPEKSEVDRLLCDNSLACRLANWRPTVTLESGLETTSRWVRDHLEIYQTDQYTV